MNECQPVQQQVGNYSLIQLLGSSDFSEVYLGEHRDTHTHVAVKLMHGYVIDGNAEKFRSHIEIVLKLHHPHIIPIIEFGIEGEIAFLVMELAKKGSLRQYHPKGIALTLETVLSYVQQITLALQYVHEHGLVHRDIKPHNMLLKDNGTIMLSDFGTAVPSHSLDASHLYDFEGTVLYTAPEQLQGRPCRRSDQYALAVVIYEWLSGDWLFSGSFHEIAHQHLFINPPSFQARGVNCPANIEQIILKALEKVPDNRFPNIKLFTEELEWAYKVAQARGLLKSDQTLPINTIPAIFPKGQFKSPRPFSDNKEL